MSHLRKTAGLLKLKQVFILQSIWCRRRPIKLKVNFRSEESVNHPTIPKPANDTKKFPILLSSYGVAVF